MKLNRKGFTLVEILAVIVILGIILTIMVPNVQTLINENKENNYKHLVKTFKTATQSYISDNRYDIVVNGSCLDTSELKEITKIENETISNSRIKISTLLGKGYIKVPKSGVIKNPKTNEALDLEASYITAKFDCQKRDYIIIDNDINLIWKNE